MTQSYMNTVEPFNQCSMRGQPFNPEFISTLGEPPRYQSGQNDRLVGGKIRSYPSVGLNLS